MRFSLLHQTRSAVELAASVDDTPSRKGKQPAAKRRRGTLRLRTPHPIKISANQRELRRLRSPLARCAGIGRGPVPKQVSWLGVHHLSRSSPSADLPPSVFLPFVSVKHPRSTVRQQIIKHQKSDTRWTIPQCPPPKVREYLDISQIFCEWLGQNSRGRSPKP